jgi:hypothetical protein
MHLVKLFYGILTNVSDSGTQTHLDIWMMGEVQKVYEFNSLNADLNHICHLSALLGVHNILHVSRIRVKHLVKSTNHAVPHFARSP